MTTRTKHTAWRQAAAAAAVIALFAGACGGDDDDGADDGATADEPAGDEPAAEDTGGDDAGSNDGGSDVAGGADEVEGTQGGGTTPDAGSVYVLAGSGLDGIAARGNVLLAPGVNFAGGQGAVVPGGAR
ncbi:MAG: hypothetical protein ACO307_15125 [Ilumatobacteraceae bacterium]